MQLSYRRIRRYLVLPLKAAEKYVTSSHVRFTILYVTELPEVFLTLGTKLRLVLSFFTLRRDFMDLKKPLTFDEQLDKLAAHGMIITDREKAKDILFVI